MIGRKKFQKLLPDESVAPQCVLCAALLSLRLVQSHLSHTHKRKESLNSQRSREILLCKTVTAFQGVRKRWTSNTSILFQHSLGKDWVTKLSSLASSNLNLLFPFLFNCPHDAFNSPGLGLHS